MCYNIYVSYVESENYEYLIKGGKIMANVNEFALDIANFGPNLKRYRLEKQLTHEKFAELLGVSSRVVYDWEDGFKRPQFQRAVDIANVLGVSLDSILRNA
jgi:DNA-binding XRE family transcriptional regulator